MNRKNINQETQSQVISLRFFNEKKYTQKQVADKLGISTITVKRYEKKYKSNLT